MSPRSRSSVLPPVSPRPMVAALPLLLVLAASAPAQRVTNLAPLGTRPPVVAHRQVAWANGQMLHWWISPTVYQQYSFVDVIERVGFVGPSRLIYLGQGGGMPGINLCLPYLVPLAPAPLHGPHTDGNSAVWATSALDIALHTGGTTYSMIASGPALDEHPHVNGRFVVWQRRSPSEIYRFDRQNGTTVSMGPANQAQYPRCDEEGRVLCITPPTGQTWLYEAVNQPVALTAPGSLGRMYTYAAHHGQVLYLERSASNAWRVILLGSGPSSRTLAQGPGINIPTAVWLRNGTAAWADSSGNLTYFDGAHVVPIQTYTSLATGFHHLEFLERGWIVYDAPQGVMLRESSLTWNQDVISAAAGGQVALDLIAGSANAGRAYVLAASISGTWPGIPLPGGLTFPLNYDPVLFLSLTQANTPLFQNTVSTLNTMGNSWAIFQAPPGLLSGLAGSYLSFAYLLYAPSFNYVSNPARVKITP